MKIDFDCEIRELNHSLMGNVNYSFLYIVPDPPISDTTLSGSMLTRMYPLEYICVWQWVCDLLVGPQYCRAKPKGSVCLFLK